MLVCLCMVANVAGAYWLSTKKPSFTEVSSSSDSCLELGTYTALKLRDYLFSTTQFCVTIKPCDCQTILIHIGLPFLVCSIRYIPFLGLWARHITRTQGSFHAALAISNWLHIATKCWSSNLTPRACSGLRMVLQSIVQKVRPTV